MGRRAGRSAEDTRRLVLDSAAAVIKARGITATLDDIAAHAGMSKGGVVYHYSSKEALLLALAEDVLASFRSFVDDMVDPRDHVPGRLTRAYIRAVLDPDTTSTEGREGMLLLSHLTAISSVAQLAQEDARRWTIALEDDGLPEDLVSVATSAADGAWLSALWGAPADPGRLTRLRETLLAMTYATEEHPVRPPDAR